MPYREQPWPSGNALDSGQRGPRFETHRRPSVLNARARPKVLSEAPSKPQGIGGNGVNIERKWHTDAIMAKLTLEI